MEWLSVASHYPLVIIHSGGCKAHRPRRSRLGVLRSIPQRKPVAVASKLHIALMEGFKRRAMADRDDGGCRQFFLEQTVKPDLRGFIERGGRFIGQYCGA
jgi:hypothetical protein